MEERKMKFNEAFEAMKQGAKIKLPGWAGFWAWEEDTIMMHCKDGKVLDIRETENPEYTFGNIASDEWIFADETNTPIMGGVALFSFSDAIRYIKRGLRVARKGWNGKGMWLTGCYAGNYEVGREFTEELERLPWIGIKTADNMFVPWVSSHTDMLAEDWYIVD